MARNGKTEYEVWVTIKKREEGETDSEVVSSEAEPITTFTEKDLQEMDEVEQYCEHTDCLMCPLYVCIKGLV